LKKSEEIMKIEIKIPNRDTFYIEPIGDGYSVHRGEKSDKRGKIHKINVKYTNTIAQALWCVFKQAVSESGEEVNNIEKLYNEIRMIKHTIFDVFGFDDGNAKYRK